MIDDDGSAEGKALLCNALKVRKVFSLAQKRFYFLLYLNFILTKKTYKMLFMSPECDVP